MRVCARSSGRCTNGIHRAQHGSSGASASQNRDDQPFTLQAGVRTKVYIRTDGQELLAGLRAATNKHSVGAKLKRVLHSASFGKTPKTQFRLINHLYPSILWFGVHHMHE